MIAIICGIYYIKNKINNKIYIGQSINIKQRFKQHKYCLSKNKHANIYLQNSYNKYKEINFEFSIIEECKKEELEIKETFYINKYNSISKSLGYNLTNNTKTHLQNNETKEKIRIANKELLINNNKNRIVNAKKINQYSLDGKFIKTWISSLEIHKKLKISIGNLNSYLNNFTTTKSLLNSMWKWDNKDYSDLNIKYKKAGRSQPITVFNNSYKKEFKLIKDAVEELNISRDSILRVLNGKLKSFKGYNIIKTI